MSDLSKSFLVRDLPVLGLGFLLVVINGIMVIGLLGYSIEPLRPLYLRVYRIDILKQDDKKELIKAVIKVIGCTVVTIILCIPEVRDNLLFYYYKMFGGI